MSGCARVDWTVDRSLEYAENPHSCTRKSERVLALEVRRLRMVEIDLKQDVWDWQRRAEEAEEKLAAKAPDDHATHSKLNAELHEYVERQRAQQGPDFLMGRPLK